MSNVKDEAIDPVTGLYKHIIKKYGDNSINAMSEIEKRETITVSTGSIRLDLALKEPFIPGVHELSGQEGAGKTTLSLEAGASAQAQGMNFFYVNVEKGLHKSLPCGIKGLDRKKMHVLNPDDGEQALDMVEHIIRSVPRSFIVIDSVPALVTEEELEKSAGQDTMAKLARLLSKYLRKINPFLVKQDSVLLFLNQLRDNVGGYGSPEVTPGGRAIRFFANSRISLRITKAGRRVNKQGKTIGQTVKATILKNRATVPYIQVEVELLFGHGIDKELEILNLGVELGIVNKGGAWLSFVYNEEEIKWQGQEKAISFLNEHPEIFSVITDQVLELYD